MGDVAIQFAGEGEYADSVERICHSRVGCPINREMCGAVGSNTQAKLDKTAVVGCGPWEEIRYTTSMSLTQKAQQKHHEHTDRTNVLTRRYMRSCGRTDVPKTFPTTGRVGLP